MSLCDDCIKGVRHEGTPTGQFTTLNGVQCYIATPEGDYPKNKVLLFLPDAFGVPLKNNQLLVDDFALNGYKTVMPDYFSGDPVPEDALDKPDSGFNIHDWFQGHTPNITRPIVDKVLAALKDDGVTELASTGYCFGARYCFDLAFEHITKATIVSHPSLLKCPDDLEKYRDISKAPLLINSCTVDQQFPPEVQKVADEILGDGKFAPGYKREYYDGCVHGFAVRGDMSDPKVKAGKEGAFTGAVQWLKKYF